MTHIPAPLSFHAYDKNGGALVFHRSSPAPLSPHLLFSVHSKVIAIKLPPSDFSFLLLSRIEKHLDDTSSSRR